MTDDQLGDVISTWIYVQLMNETERFDRKIRRGEGDPNGTEWDQMERDAEEAARQTLGDEAYARWEKRRLFREFHVDESEFTETERDGLYQIQKQMRQSRRELGRAYRMGAIDNADYQSRTVELQKEYDGQLAGLLGQERGAKLKQYSEWSYGPLRWSLRELKIADPQIDAVYKATRKANEEQQELARLSQSGLATDGRTWQTIQAAKDQEIERILGSQSYAEYKKVTDEGYKQLKRFAPAWQLSTDDIEFVYTTVAEQRRALQDYQKQARDMQAAGEKVDWKAVGQASEDYRRETEAQLRQRLGDERLAKLKRAGVLR